MAVSAQRDLVSSMKTETFLNVSITSKLHPLPWDLKQLFNKDALEKLTQNVFNPLSYYLVSIVDPGKASSFSWPLYDTKTERAYRNELSSFIADYSGKGLLSPVMSSYLVNPACYKVTLFTFQLSQLAVQCTLKSIMKTDRQKKLYTEVTEKYKSQSQEGFVEAVEKEKEAVLQKLSNYLEKRKGYERIAELFRNGIKSMEDKMTKLKPKEKIVHLVDSFQMDNSIDEETKTMILEIKNLKKPAQYFNKWLEDIDLELDGLETEWNNRISPIVKSASKTMELSKELIERQTGETDKKSFVVEYNPNTDEICTKELQEKVNSQQKYILQNIVNNGRLSFPYLIRGYVVAVGYILKDKQFGDIGRFNRHLEHINKSYSEMVETMRTVMERLRKAEARLEPLPISFNQSVSRNNITEPPPLPDLSELTMKRAFNSYSDVFTPLGPTSRQFNLRKTSTTSFLKPQNGSLMYQAPRDDFLKNFISCPTYDRQNSTSNVNNLSIISHVQARSNQTIAVCASGFTKQQIQRLLSTTKKSSSTKKHKFKLDRPSMIIKKGGLFNVSSTSKAFNVSNTSGENGLFQCHSSPNLFENKENKYSKRSRKLSIMQEGSPSLLEVPGIMAIEEKFTRIEKTPIIEFPSFPIPTLFTMPAEAEVIDNLNENINNIENSFESGIASMCSKKSLDHDNDTPKSKIPVPIKRTSSIEEIINRFKKVKANIAQEAKDDEIRTILEEKEANIAQEAKDNEIRTILEEKEANIAQEAKDNEIRTILEEKEANIAQEAKDNEIRTILEEKESFNAVNIDMFTANKVLLPDLLSPSCSTLPMKVSEFLDQIDDVDKTEGRRSRESLGTALGVDNTFLDQFDIID